MKEIHPITNAYNHPQDRALCKFLYLFGARVTEALRTLSGDLDIKEFEGENYLVIERLPTLKNRRRPFRALSVKVHDIEGKLAKELLDEWADYIAADQKLFNHTRQRAYNHLSKQTITVQALMPNGEIEIIENFKIRPHYFRHCRASHLVEYHDFGEYELTRYMGWTDPKLAEFYVHMNWRAFARKMKG